MQSTVHQSVYIGNQEIITRINMTHKQSSNNMWSTLLAVTLLLVTLLHVCRPLPVTSPADPNGAIILGLRQQSSGRPDQTTGVKVASWTIKDKVNPEELGGYLEGDLLLPSGLYQQRNGVIDAKYRWPKGVVPYRFGDIFSDASRKLILQAINAFHVHTCVRFVAYTNQSDYVSIEQAKTGCWATLGRVGSMQRVNLQDPGCLYRVGTTIHELMHTIGFLHEHSSLERDSHVTINWQNIQTGTEHNFKKYNTTTFGIGYDYESVLHYSAHAFSKNGEPTIVPKATKAVIGQRSGFSANDIAKIRAMYKCKGSVSELL